MANNPVENKVIQMLGLEPAPVRAPLIEPYRIQKMSREQFIGEAKTALRQRFQCTR